MYAILFCSYIYSEGDDASVSMEDPHNSGMGGGRGQGGGEDSSEDDSVLGRANDSPFIMNDGDNRGSSSSGVNVKDLEANLLSNSMNFDGTDVKGFMYVPPLIRGRSTSSVTSSALPPSSSTAVAVPSVQTASTTAVSQSTSAVGYGTNSNTAQNKERPALQAMASSTSSTMNLAAVETPVTVYVRTVPVTRLLDISQSGMFQSNTSLNSFDRQATATSTTTNKLSLLMIRGLDRNLSSNSMYTADSIVTSRTRSGNSTPLGLSLHGDSAMMRDLSPKNTSSALSLRSLADYFKAITVTSTSSTTVTGDTILCTENSQGPHAFSGIVGSTYVTLYQVADSRAQVLALQYSLGPSPLLFR